jgi:hypothetical protein
VDTPDLMSVASRTDIVNGLTTDSANRGRSTSKMSMDPARYQFYRPDRRTVVNGERHSWGDTVREIIDAIPGISVSALRRLNRLPFVVGVLSLGGAALGVIALASTAIVGRPSPEFWSSPWYIAAQSVVLTAFGLALIALYYKLRE